MFTGSDDFTSASSTAPNKTGTIAGLPSTCTVGQTYFETNATAGQNLFGCTAANTWSQLSGGGGGGAVTESRLMVPVRSGGFRDWGIADAAASSFCNGGSGAQLPCSAYFGPASNTQIYAQQELPANWTGTANLTIEYSINAAGDVKFNLNVACPGTDVFTIPTYATVTTGSIAVAGDSNSHSVTLSNILSGVSGCASSGRVYLVLIRDTSVSGNAAGNLHVMTTIFTVSHT